MTGFDIETRIAAVNSLAQLTLELLNTQTSPALALLATAGQTSSAAARQASAPAVAAAVVTGCVCATLLAALDDYSRDNRGDVGSWVREAAMDGLAQVTLALGAMVQQQHQHQQQDAEQQQQQEDLVTTAAAVLAQGAASLSIQASEQQQQQQVGELAIDTEQQTAGDHIQLSAAALQQLHHRLSLLAVNGLLSQAVERIARLRESALLHLQSLLAQPSTAAAVPGAAAVAAALPGDAVELAGVASLACVARLAALLQLPYYRLALLKGLVACVGGVDASLAKAAATALLAQVEVLPAAAAVVQGVSGSQQHRGEVRSDVAGLLLKLWQQHAG